MNIRNVLLTMGFLTASLGIAQGPLYDRIMVTLPYPMNVNGTVLQAGDYEIRQHQSAAGGSRIVHFYTNQGMKFETTAMAIPALDNRTPEETKLILDHIGSEYYLSKIWVQGKNYGYEFPIPESVKLRENERTAPSSVVARYEAGTGASSSATAIAAADTAVQTSETTRTTTTERTERTEVAQAAPAPKPAPAPAVVEPAPVRAEEPRVETPVAAAPAPAVTTSERVEMAAADRPTRTMPATAGNWLSLLLGGGLLSSAGLALRRFRS